MDMERLEIIENKPYTIFICGIGGQGIISLSKKIAEILTGNPNITNLVLSESRGVSQRQGMVTALIRFVYSKNPGSEKTNELMQVQLAPMPYDGIADIFIGLELLESIRNLKYLSKRGIALINFNEIYPKNVKQEDITKIKNTTSQFNQIISNHYPDAKIVKIERSDYESNVEILKKLAPEIFSG